MTSAPTSYRGRHEIARRGNRLPVLAPRSAPRRWPGPVIVLGSAGLAYAGAWRAGPLTDPPPGAAELSLLRSAESLGAGADTAAALQIAAWNAVWDFPSALTAARALMVMAAVATVLCTGGLARRVGLSLPALAVATVVTAALPWAMAGHRLVVPINLAVAWLLAAALLASTRTRRRPALVAAALCLLIALATAPLVVPIAVLAVAVLLADRDLGAGWPVATRIAGVATLSVLAAGLFAVVTGDGFGFHQPAPDIAPVAVDLIVGGVVVVGAAAGTLVRWLRPFALVVLGCAVVAAVAGPARTPLLLFALPAAAIVLGAAIDAAASAGLGRHVRPTPARVGVLVAVVLAAGVALVGTVHM
ncbi:hypothetical protein [Cryptosporangium arvum]|uniref:hypothetical protein n=1 Tax=Cryptosporangium arvum TaxID=80871 RepID=UPI0005652A78|nr:hypothetical protein [Cryptosporangium arvum]